MAPKAAQILVHQGSRLYVRHNRRPARRVHYADGVGRVVRAQATSEEHVDGFGDAAGALEKFEVLLDALHRSRDMTRRQRHWDIAVGEEWAEPYPRLDSTGCHVDALRAWVLFAESCGGFAGAVDGDFHRLSEVLTGLLCRTMTRLWSVAPALPCSGCPPAALARGEEG